MNTRTVVCWISTALLVASASLATGCPSDPSDSEFNENAGEADTDLPDAGDTGDDADDPDADPDADDPDTDAGPEPDECLVPDEGNTLTDALEAGCGPEGKEVKLDDDVGVDALGTNDDPVEIDGQVIIEPHEDYDGGDPPVLRAPVYGLFDVDGNDTELELRSLDITSNGDNIDNALISVTAGATLTTNDVRIRDVATTEDGPLAVDCSGAELVLENDTSISDNHFGLDASQASAVALDDCTLLVDDSAIYNNFFDLHTADADAAAVDCTGSHINLLDASISNNHVDATFGSLADDKLSFHGAGLHLHECTLDATASTIDANRLALTVEDFDHDAKDEFDIALRGAGVYAIDSDITLANGSVVSGNEVDVDLENDGTQVDIDLFAQGSGLALFETEFLSTESTVEENRIDKDVDGSLRAHHDTGGFGIYSSGAGAYFHSNADHVFKAEQSTISENSITAHGNTYTSGFRSTDDTGAGISFSTTADAQLQMANSTVMQNSITGGDSARGAGVFVQAPSIPEFEEGSSSGGFLGSLGDALADALFGWIGDEDIALTSVIRYSTIAQNTIDAENPAGVGYYVGIHPDADDEDEGPFISSIALLLNANDDLVDDQVYDCDGTATTAAPEEEGEELIEGDFNWMSTHNVHNTHVNSSQDECSDLLGGAGTALVTFSSISDDANSVLIPTDQNPPVDFGEENPHCSGIYTGSDNALSHDQRGDQRPVGDACDAGAVELQSDDLDG